EMAQDLVSYFHENNVTFFLQADSGVYAEPSSMDNIVAAFKALGRTEEEIKDIFGLTILEEHPERIPGIEKCCYFQCPLEADVVQRELGPAYYVVDSSYKVSRFCDGEINKAGVTKALGMEKYLEHVGVPHEDSIAFGDGPNDLEMIQYAHTGVVMGNGTDNLKALADRVCGRIDEDGIYNGFQELGLI
ncbi:MAG: HAD hydrolase family protein, partial [Clostridia bacterium]|nr:HAD hydrolase family protein [Clostridia bacterium]